MNNIPASLLLGPLFLIALFIICLILVAGIKLLYFYFKRAPINLKPLAKKPVKPKPQPTVKPARSIEINPDEVDKIYVKKVS